MAMAAFKELQKAHPHAKFLTHKMLNPLAKMYLGNETVISKYTGGHLIDLDNVYEEYWQRGEYVSGITAFCKKLECAHPHHYPLPVIPDKLKETAEGLMSRIPYPRVAVGFSSLRTQATWGTKKLRETFACAPKLNFVLFSKAPLRKSPIRGGNAESLMGQNVYDLTSQTTATELVAAVAECDLVLTIDTLLAHVASSLNKPTVLLTTNPLHIPPGRVITFQGNTPCWPCLPRVNSNDCPNPHCLDWIAPQMIANLLIQWAENP